MQHLDKELVLFYDEQSYNGKQTLAYAHTISKSVNKQELSQSKLSPTIFKIMLQKLEARPKDLLNKSQAEYQDNVRGKDFDDEGWLNIIRKKPNLLKSPIAMFNGKAVICKTPTDILKLLTP